MLAAAVNPLPYKSVLCWRLCLGMLLLTVDVETIWAYSWLRVLGNRFAGACSVLHWSKV